MKKIVNFTDLLFFFWNQKGLGTEEKISGFKQTLIYRSIKASSTSKFLFPLLQKANFQPNEQMIPYHLLVLARLQKLPRHICMALLAGHKDPKLHAGSL